MDRSAVVPLRQPEEIVDLLTEMLRSGARRLIAQAVEAEFEAFVSERAELRLPDGRRRVVRHGRAPTRAIQTGIGPVEAPRRRERASASARRSCRSGRGAPGACRRLDALPPILCLTRAVGRRL